MRTEAQPDAVKIPGARVLLVVSPYYGEVAAMLERGAAEAAAAAGAVLARVSVPGALELPGAIGFATHAHDAFVALGCVVRGETSHYDYVCSESARGLMDLSLRGVPVGNGILTVDTIAQAEERADPARGDKGGVAVRASLALLALKRQYAR